MAYDPNDKHWEQNPNCSHKIVYKNRYGITKTDSSSFLGKMVNERIIHLIWGNCEIVDIIKLRET